jgi:probable F420-dependent oxidoreductase
VVLLSAIAAATQRIRLVAGALISPLRHPLILAKDLATLDNLSGGRLVVQPTVSWHREEYDALGVPFASRGDILDEQLAIWSRAWSGSPVTFDGTHFRFDDVWIEPQPSRACGPPLWFGGSSVHGRVVDRIARYGSGFNPLGQPDDAGMARLEEALISAGRSPAEIEYVGGTRGTFSRPDQVADLDQALAAVPALMARGFTTICVKPSQFIDDAAAMAGFCRELAAKTAALG